MVAMLPFSRMVTLPSTNTVWYTYKQTKAINFCFPIYTLQGTQWETSYPKWLNMNILLFRDTNKIDPLMLNSR